MSEEELEALVSRISYKGGYFIYRDGFTVKVGFTRTDVFTGQEAIGYGGTATILPDALPGDVVRTIFGLFKALEEHECREWFTVDGVQVFSPHLTLEALLEAGWQVQGREERP